MTMTTATKTWEKSVIKENEITKYLNKDGSSFINNEEINKLINTKQEFSKAKFNDILAKSSTVQRLDPKETAFLFQIKDPELLEIMYKTAGNIKNKVYGTRIVTFAPLYCSNLCVNNCRYCGFKKDNTNEIRRKLTIDEIRQEAEALENMGHKRLIMVYGEHPESDFDYMAETIKAVYKTKSKKGEIRRVNINAAPMETEKLRYLNEIGIGTYQVFQETYHQETYSKYHPEGTIKGNYLWRLYALHRAYEAGVDDLGLGALFGLYDYRYEIMGLLYHTIDLENKFAGVGPHTISFPRIKSALGTELAHKNKYLVNDTTLKKVIAIIRLSIPYTGMILTARESREVRNDVIDAGCTQLDASSKLGIGSYAENKKLKDQDLKKQQFHLDDTRSLDELIRDLAASGRITSFCTAGYRCGRTGDAFMKLAKGGNVNNYCMPNAILTFKEYLMDYASEETRQIGEKLIKQDLEKIPSNFKSKIKNLLIEIENGKRDLRI